MITNKQIQEKISAWSQHSTLYDPADPHHVYRVIRYSENATIIEKIAWSCIPGNNLYLVKTTWNLLTLTKVEN
jgi:hypothetical protein